MKLLKRQIFYNTLSNEFIVSVSIYEDDIWYKCITEIGENISGKTMLRKSHMNDYYNQEINGIKQSLINQGISFTVKEL